MSTTRALTYASCIVSRPARPGGLEATPDGTTPAARPITTGVTSQVANICANFPHHPAHF